MIRNTFLTKKNSMNLKLKMLEPRRWGNEKRLDVQVQKRTETNTKTKFFCAIILMLFLQKVL